MNQEDMELIFKIYRIPNKDGIYNPGVVDVASHDITPLWVAATAYCIFAKYIDRVPENLQIQFQEEAIDHLKFMLEHGMQYLVTKSNLTE